MLTCEDERGPGLAFTGKEALETPSGVTPDSASRSPQSYRAGVRSGTGPGWEGDREKSGSGPGPGSGRVQGQDGKGTGRSQEWPGNKLEYASFGLFGTLL